MRVPPRLPLPRRTSPPFAHCFASCERCCAPSIRCSARAPACWCSVSCAVRRGVGRRELQRLMPLPVCCLEAMPGPAPHFPRALPPGLSRKYALFQRIAVMQLFRQLLLDPFLTYHLFVCYDLSAAQSLDAVQAMVACASEVVQAMLQARGGGRGGAATGAAAATRQHWAVQHPAGITLYISPPTDLSPCSCALVCAIAGGEQGSRG